MSLTNNRRVFLIMQPSVRRNGETVDLSGLTDFGSVVVLVETGDELYRTPERVLRKMRQRLEQFDPARDYLVWAGGDTLAAVWTGIILCELDLRQVQWLRWERHKNRAGERLHTGLYTPRLVPMVSDGSLGL